MTCLRTFRSRTKNSTWPTSNPINYSVGQWLSWPLCLLGPFSLCNLNICKALINFLKCPLWPYNGAEPFNKVRGGKGETPSRELNRGGCHGESPHNKHGEELPSQHLKALEHPAPGLFTAGWRWGPGERGYVHCNSGPTGGWIDRLCRRPNSRQGSEFSQREIVLVWALPHSPPPVALGSAAMVWVVHEVVLTTPPVCDEA